MMTTRTTLLTVAVLLSKGTLAWVAPVSRNAVAKRTPMVSQPLVLRSVVEDATTSTVALASASTTNDGLLPEYEAAYNVIVAELEANVPEAYKEKMMAMLPHFAKEYLTANQNNMIYSMASDDENIKENAQTLCHPENAAKRFLTCLNLGLTWGLGPNKYQFEVYHKALLGEDPQAENGNELDYMKFGNDFFRPCMDLTKSVLMGMDKVDTIISQLDQGHNVIFFANHQSEADPQVVSCLTDAMTEYGKRFDEMIYVAGHKVTTDPLAVPFSMGRNLICIHSKKHINADAATKPEKQKQNLKAMSALTDRLKQGGALIWLAPSGGRDRRNVETGDVPIAPFDSKTIDMFRLVSNKSKVPTHFYTMSLVSYELCPPPDTVEAGVGEARNVRFVPCGLAIGNECESTGGLEGRKEFCNTVFTQCEADYEKLVQATSN